MSQRKEIKKFVTFWTPGSFVAESDTKDVNSFNPQTVKWPDYAYAFQFSRREDIIVDDKRYQGETKKIGPLYYHPDSKVETLAQVRKNPNATDILIRNMECNKWREIVWSRWGNWPQRFNNKDDLVLVIK